MTEYLSIKELSKYSSLSPGSLRGLIQSGELPCIQLRRKILVKRTDFDYWARRRQRQHRSINPVVKRLADMITSSM